MFDLNRLFAIAAVVVAISPFSARAELVSCQAFAPTQTELERALASLAGSWGNWRREMTSEAEDEVAAATRAGEAAGQMTGGLAGAAERIRYVARAFDAASVGDAGAAFIAAFLRAFQARTLRVEISLQEVAEIARQAREAAVDRIGRRDTPLRSRLARWQYELWGASRSTLETSVRALLDRDENWMLSSQLLGYEIGREVAAVIATSVRAEPWSTHGFATAIESMLLYRWNARSLEADRGLLLGLVVGLSESRALTGFMSYGSEMASILEARDRAMALRSSARPGEERTLAYVGEFAQAIQRMALRVIAAPANGAPRGEAPPAGWSSRSTGGGRP